MEVILNKLGESDVEQLQESVNVLCCRSRVGYSGCSVRVAYSNGAVEEDHVGVAVPRILVESGVLSLVGNGARSQFKQKSSGRRASGS